MGANAVKEQAAEAVREAKQRTGMTWREIVEGIDRPEGMDGLGAAGNAPGAARAGRTGGRDAEP